MVLKLGMRSPSKPIIKSRYHLSVKVAKKSAPSGFAVGAGLLAATLLASQSRASENVSSVTNTPVVMRHVDGTNFGSLLAGDTVFFCTNQTSQSVLLTAPAIEIKSGSTWATDSGPYLQTIWFAAAGSNTTTLEPRQAGYCIIRFSPLRFPSPGAPPNPPGLNCIPVPPPTGSVWRLSAQVQNKLSGLSDASARVKESADQFRNRPGGNASASLTNIWSQRTSFFSVPVATVVTEGMPAP
jgi:hypothetical protein